MLRSRLLWMVALLIFCRRALSAQDLTGNWGRARLPRDPDSSGSLLHIEKGEGAAWKATPASVDQSPDWGAATPVDS